MFICPHVLYYYMILGYATVTIKKRGGKGKNLDFFSLISLQVPTTFRVRFGWGGKKLVWTLGWPNDSHGRVVVRGGIESG